MVGYDHLQSKLDILIEILKKDMFAQQAQLKAQQAQLKKDLKEVNMALMFQDVIKESAWLKYRDFAFGGYAIDYATAYTLFRVLNQMNPVSLLEFGLGQSSKLIHQYASYHHQFALTIEHSDEWVEFFLKDVGQRYPLNIKHSELKTVMFKGFETFTYDGLELKLGDRKFDFVFVDGPYGFNDKGNLWYSRTQIIDVARNHLMDSFCIILHDYNREGEQRTAREVMDVLDNTGRKYLSKVVRSGARQHILICSQDLSFVKTMCE